MQDQVQMYSSFIIYDANITRHNIEDVMSQYTLMMSPAS